MEKLSFIFLIFCVGIPCASLHFLYPSDAASEEKARRYSVAKGAVYLVLVTVSIIYDLVIMHNYSPSLLLTICIALFEGSQILAQEIAWRRQKEAEMAMQAHQKQNDPFLKNVEHLFSYCSTQLISMKEAHETIDAKQLAYEKIYDYLKYYYCASHFLELFEKYVAGAGCLEELDAALYELKGDFEMTVTEIVKMPQY